MDVKDLEKQLNQVYKITSKQGKYIEEIEKNVALLKKDSHPPQEYVCCKNCGCRIAKIK
jgi:hypothetical protein